MGTMGNYQQIESHFDLVIVPQCAAICSTMLCLPERDAYEELKRVLDAVEREVLSPLHALDADLGAKSDYRELAQAVHELVVYLNEKIALLVGRRGNQDDIELALQPNKNELEEAIAKWKWLESGAPRMPGAWPQT